MQIKIISPLPVSRWREYKNLRLESCQENPTAFLSVYENELKRPDKFWQDRIKTSNTAETFFAEIKDQVIGSTTLLFNPKENNSHVCNIVGVYVKSKFRNQGVGKKLLETALARAKKKALKKVKISVSETQKKAKKLYLSLGFEPVGIYKDEIFFENKYYDELALEKFI